MTPLTTEQLIAHFYAAAEAGFVVAAYVAAEELARRFDGKRTVPPVSTWAAFNAHSPETRKLIQDRLDEYNTRVPS